MKENPFFLALMVEIRARNLSTLFFLLLFLDFCFKLCSVLCEIPVSTGCTKPRKYSLFWSCKHHKSIKGFFFGINSALNPWFLRSYQKEVNSRIFAWIWAVWVLPTHIKICSLCRTNFEKVPRKSVSSQWPVEIFSKRSL